MDINQPKLFLNALQKFLEKRSVFFQFVTDSKLQSFTHSHSAITSYSEGKHDEMGAFESMCKQFVDKFDQHLRCQLLTVAPTCPSAFWPGSRCVTGYDSCESLRSQLLCSQWRPNLLGDPDTLVPDRFAIRRSEDGWIVPNYFIVSSIGKRIHPAYSAARYETRFWIRPSAIWGRTKVEDFARIQWSQGRFHIQCQFGYDIDREEVRQDCVERLTPGSDLTIIGSKV